ncbi:MAG: ABC transporter permease [Bacteroidetes bacterium]|nr:ABC transporter permease [Bacteroidota bacterium]MBL6963355.1 ABC transporter permease [Bacteroidota bacterium]
MKTIIYILQKEFIQVFRDKTMLPMIFFMPIIQLIVLVNAATFEMNSINLVVVDKDLSTSSRQLVNKFKGSEFYHLKESTFSLKDAEDQILHRKADAILHIHKGFEQDLITENNGKIQLLVNAINSTAAGLINAYTTMIISSYNNQVRAEMINMIQARPVKQIKVSTSFWYNPEMNYKTFMLPGILVILVTAIGMILTAINLVREKEMGTIEQINVTPIRKHHFLIGKLLPFWIIAIFELAFGLLIGKVLYQVPFVGSIPLLFLFASIYILVALGIGLLISTLANSQQQVMFIAFFFLIVFILMSGIFTPVESMPYWAQKVNVINPFSYFMKAIRMIMLKGSGFFDVLKEMLSLFVYAFIVLSLAVWRYRKVA